MNYMTHCKTSARKYGGKPEDYIKIHEWFDQTKKHLADLRHRVILHNSFGIQLCIQVFGHTIKNSDGKDVPVQKIAEDHILEDQGCIPTLGEVLAHTPITDIQHPKLRMLVGAAAKVERQLKKQDTDLGTDEDG